MSPPPVPIIDSAGANVLSLFEVEVNISLLTNGGQSVTNYIVSWLLMWQVCAWAEVCKMVPCKGIRWSLRLAMVNSTDVCTSFTAG